MILATQRGRKESHTTLIKAVFAASRFASGCHVKSEEELSTCLVKIHWKSDLERRAEEGVSILNSHYFTVTFEQVVTKNAGEFKLQLEI